MNIAIRAKLVRFLVGRAARQIGGYRRDTGKLPEFLFDAPFVTLKPEKAVGGALVGDRYEALKLYPKGGVVVEVGTQEGKFARHILDTCRPDKLYVIDVDFRSFKDAAFQKEIDSGQLVKLEGYSDKVLARFDDASLKWLYIDGGHSHVVVKKDLELAVRKVEPNGFIVVNDYVLWSAFEMIPYGIVQAVNELCNTSDWRFRYFALNHLGHFDVTLTPGNSVLD